MIANQQFHLGGSPAIAGVRSWLGGSTGGLPAPPTGYAYLQDANGDYVLDANGDYVLVKVG